MTTATTSPNPRLSPGEPAPPFTLPDDTGATVSLADYAGRRLLIYVYPAALTPGCTTEARDFRDQLAVFSQAGIEVVAVSPDPPAKLARFRATESLDFPLLSDPGKDMLTRYGAFGAKKLYGKEVTGVIRSTFVISPAGTVEVAQYNVKATGHVAKLLRELDLAARS